MGRLEVKDEQKVLFLSQKDIGACVISSMQQ
jgi:hypothetical protein